MAVEVQETAIPRLVMSFTGSFIQNAAIVWHVSPVTKTLLFIGLRGSEAPDLVFGTPDAAGTAIEARRGDAAAPPEVRAIDKATGATVHSAILPAAPTGSPMTYMANGNQYIVLAYGAGSSTGLLGLALP